MSILPVFLLAGALAATAQEQQFAEIKAFRLQSGQTLPSVKLGYRTVGTLNATRSNAVLFPTWFGGNSQSLLQYAAKDKLVDPAKHFVVLIDALGNGVSTSPSNTPQLPVFNIRDMVESEYRLASEVLGIRKLHAVIGISMGGMQSFEWAVAHPEYASRIVPIIGSPKQSTPDLLLWQAQLSAIETAVANGIDPRAIMPAVQAMHNFALRTPEYAADEQPAADFPKLKESFVKSARTGVHPLDWASQLRAMMAQDIGHGESLEKAAARVTAKMLIVVATQDHMVNPKTALAFARIGGHATLELTGNCGHMALGCEQARLSSIVRNFLERDSI
ncbi:MAG: alpha/beta fold hydrolase [Bryobacteraceae bacterium]